MFRQKRFTPPVRGENALKEVYLRKALSLVDSELELLHLHITRPEAFAARELLVASASSPRLSLLPKFPNLGIMGMTELLTALALLGGIEDTTGKPPAVIALAEAFERAFGFSFHNIYDRQCKLFKRKPYNLTKTLDALKAVLVKEGRKRGSDK